MDESRSPRHKAGFGLIWFLAEGPQHGKTRPRCDSNQGAGFSAWGSKARYRLSLSALTLTKKAVQASADTDTVP